MIPRYSRPEMADLWTARHRLELWRDVELFSLEGAVEQGLAPGEALADCVAKAGTFSEADVAEINAIEKTTKHDVIAFLTFLERRIGPSARYLHLGMTSSDVLDTALAVQLKQAGALLMAGLGRVKVALEKRAFEHRLTPMIGRSHGIHAEPITFGLKLAVWFDEVSRHEARLRSAIARAAVGKVSGAVGTFAHLPPAVEAHVCRRLGITAEPAATQVVQRDRHAEYFNVLAQIGSSIEKFATEIRHLQRTEVREAEEPFTPGQKGSSAMPHKRNPIASENLSGLARLLRGYALSAMEDVALWHERDISHSSVERIIGPDATGLLDFMLHRFAGLMEELRVYPERMKENLQEYGGLVHSQRLLLELARKGLDRQAAYVLVQRNAMKVWEVNADFRTSLQADPEVRQHLSAAEIDACFDLDHHFRHVDELFVRVFGRRTASAE